MRKIIRYSLAVATTLVILILLWQFSIAIVLFVLSLALAGALRPTINYLAERRKSKRLALGIVYTLLVGSILAFLLLIGQLLPRDLQRATDDFVTAYERAITIWPNEGTLFQQVLAEQLPPAADLYQGLTRPEGVPALEGIFGAAQDFFSILGNIAVIIILSLYWTADQLRFERLGLSLLPAEYRPKALHVWRFVEAEVGAYLRSEIIQSLFAGLFLGAGYWLMGVSYPVLFTLWGALARLIPWFGVLIATLPLLLIEAANFLLAGRSAAVYAICILLLLQMVIEPRFFRRQRYSSLLIIIFVIILAELFGVIGVMLAPLLAVTSQILFQQLYPISSQRSSREALEQIIELRKRLAQVQSEIRGSHSRQSTLIVNKLNHLVKQVTDYIQEY
ncbi:MAG TPA: AI-2E family transporter [Anaerolineales bacterium]|nr:AI-2E family transporter [Anaerolineales bacterium]